jgi:hypothetical protein
MAVVEFQCHACRQVMRVGADKAGRKAKCPQCAAILTIPESAPDLEPLEEVEAISTEPRRPAREVDRYDDRRRDDDYERDRDRDRRRRDDYDDRPRKSPNKTDWPRVHMGMRLSSYGFLTLLIAFGVYLLGSLFLTIESLRDNPNLFDFAFGGMSAMYTIGAVIVRLAFLGMLGGMILTLVGNIFFLWTANKHATLPFSIAGVSSMGFCVLYFLSFQLWSLMSFLGAFGIFGFSANFNFWMLGLHAILISFYYKGLARITDSERLESQAKLLLILGSIVVGVQTVFPIIQAAVFNPALFVLRFGEGPGFGARLTLAILHWLSVFPTAALLFFHMMVSQTGIRATRQ